MILLRKFSMLVRLPAYERRISAGMSRMICSRRRYFSARIVDWDLTEIGLLFEARW